MPTIWIIAFILQWVVLLLLVCLMAGLLRYLGSIQDKIEEVIPLTSRFIRGEHTADFELPDLQGHIVTSKSLLTSKRTLLLLFLTTTCDSCRALLGDITKFTATYHSLTLSEWSIALICVGELEAVTLMLQGHSQQLAGVHILVDRGAIVTRRYGIRGAPFGMALNSRGQIIQQTLGPTLDWLQSALGIVAASSVQSEEKEGMTIAATGMKLATDD